MAQTWTTQRPRDVTVRTPSDGPAAAGTTAVADAYARTCTQPTDHISLDDLRDWLKSGYYDPADGWSPEAERQYARARTICADAARRYHADGISTVIDDAVFPAWPAVSFEAWAEEIGLSHIMLVALLPRVEAVQVRNGTRTGHRKLGSQMLRIIYDAMMPWRDAGVPVIDTTELSIAETVTHLRAAIAHAYSP